MEMTVMEAFSLGMMAGSLMTGLIAMFLIGISK